MSDFLLELRSEEIPARMQAGARKELEKLFRREMDASGVAVGELTVWSTPRRLALIVRDLPDATEAVSEEAKGPPVGAPDQAVDGFCRKNGVSRDDLEVRDVKGRETYFAVKNVPGRAMSDLLAAAIPAIIRDFSWPKSMRWGAASMSTESLRWVRPLSGIVALLGEDVVDCEVHGIRSGRETTGHRFHDIRKTDPKSRNFGLPIEIFKDPNPTVLNDNGMIEIGSADDYPRKLADAHVIVNHEAREDEIRLGAAVAAKAAGLTLVEDEGLVIENAGLTEWPVPLLGRFDDDFLDVPPETIQLTARVNQKYFVCEDAQGNLANAFICTANIDPVDPAVVVDGNRKVLAARLSDARFFWEVDRKTSLADHAKKLERITFHEKLGTVADKVERTKHLAHSLVDHVLKERGEAGSEDAEYAFRAASLARADLVTEMVGEFPELQGLMGAYYAAAANEPAKVVTAIREQYLPQGKDGSVPSEHSSIALNLADKFDTITTFFMAKMAPTGSSDPFALRRACLGAIRIIEENGVRLHIKPVVGHIARHLADQLTGQPFGTTMKVTDPNFGQLESKGFMAVDKLQEKVLEFFADRLKVQQREAGVRHDLIDAVFALGGEDDLVRLLARVHALQSFIETENGTNLLAGYKRAANILKKEDWDSEPEHTGDEDPLENVDNPDLRDVYAEQLKASHTLSYTPESAEKALIDALDAAEPQADAAIAKEDFAAAMAALASLRAPIDAFFEEVTVNDDDANKRNARLDLLARFRAAVHNVADFSKIEG